MKDTQPRFGVSVLVIARVGGGDHEERVILGRRGKGGNTGRWVIPGGGVNLCEHWQDAGAREFLEETGLVVEVVSPPIDVMEFIDPENQSHRVSLVVYGSLVSSITEMKAGSDLSDVRAFKWEEIPWAEVSPKVREVLVKRQPPGVKR